MPTVLGTGLQMVKDLLPEQVGTNKRWTDAFVQAMLVCADRAVRERIGSHFHEQEIALTDDTATYSLDSEFVAVTRVEFAADGATYDWELKARSLKGLSDMAPKWRDSRGTRPDFYDLLSAPGTQSSTSPAVVGSRITIYPCISGVTDQKVRVSGIGILADYADMAAANAGIDVLKKCHVPYVLAVLYASESPGRGAQEYQNFVDGCAVVKNRFSVPGALPSRAVRT